MSESKSLGWFELIAACMGACVVSVALSYALFQYELGRAKYQPLVMDFRGIAKAHFAKLQEDTAKEKDPELVQQIMSREGMRLAEIIQSLADKGYVVLERNQAIAYPQELDVTQMIAERLGIGAVAPAAHASSSRLGGG